MAVSADFKLAWGYSSETLPFTVTVSSAGTLIAIDETIPPSSTNLQVALAFAYAKVKGYFMVAPAAMTLEFNNSTTGVPTVALAANVPQVWYDGNAHTSLFTEDVTTMYITSTAGGLLRMRFLIDPT